MSDQCCKSQDVNPHSHDQELGFSIKTYLPAIISFLLLLVGIFMDQYGKPNFFQNELIHLVWYLAAYLVVGFPVFKEAFATLSKGDYFTEFTLMSVATLGAFALGEYPEGVAVMLFYTIGELFQTAAVNRSKNHIKALLDVRPKQANVWRNQNWVKVDPENVEIGEKIQVKSGEKLPLDGILLSETSMLNTSAITGESKPQSIYKGESILAGMLNLGKVIEVQTTKKFEDSSLAKILQMVQEASSKKAKTELFIRKFARVYTPIVFCLAVGVTFLPYFFVENYEFREWLYKALIFLVISCPCALVISIPLGYFGGIGAASRNGILVKGSTYLDILAKVNAVIFDKTGTLTKGVFTVQKVECAYMEKTDFLNYASALESNSTHPIAKAIQNFQPSTYVAEDVEEISGHGLKGRVNQKMVIAGNHKLFQKLGINYPKKIDEIVETTVLVAIDKKYEGYIVIADEIKEDAPKSMIELKNSGVTQLMMLSGDKQSIVEEVAKKLGIEKAYGNLLPEDKVKKLEELKSVPNQIIAFVGDGINDAPVLAMSDVGIAMGALGSDAAIETADVVIQTDQLSKIPIAIKIGKKTKQIVLQNIFLAFSVKLAVMILGAGGCATMWEAVFADVGVAFLAILNSIRIQHLKF